MKKRIGNLEFRLNDDKRSPEIVGILEQKDGTETCYTLVFYERDNEGYNIHFIGPRPFDESVDRNDFWKLLKFGQKICDACFRVEQE